MTSIEDLRNFLIGKTKANIEYLKNSADFSENIGEQIQSEEAYLEVLEADEIPTFH